MCTLNTLDGPIAVNVEEMRQFGCPQCGYRSGTTPVSGGGAAVWECGECEYSCVILGEGVTKSPIGLGTSKGTVYPELQDHPRRGTPAHGRPDKSPEGDGEYFASRGIGLDQTPGCFVCGGGVGLFSNIAAFVQCKEAGERVVGMFGGKGARMDYREYEPDRVQVKIGACDTHKPNLKKLHELTSAAADGVITTEMIEEARRL